MHMHESLSPETVTILKNRLNLNTKTWLYQITANLVSSNNRNRFSPPLEKVQNWWQATLTVKAV